MTIKVGVIGAGTVGALRAQSVKEDSATKLAAVLDISQDAADKAVAGSAAKTFSELPAFLESGLEAIIVSTPPHLHEEACVGAFQRGCHVFCEKPLSNTVDGARRIVDAAIAADRILAVGFNMRYYPCMKFVREAIDQGRIGRLEHLRIFGGHDGLHNFRAEWQYRMPESGGGAMMDVGIHMTDMARWLLGEISSVYGVMSETVWNIKGSEDNAIAILKNPEGISASYHTTWSEWRGYSSSVEAFGDKGMVRGSYAPMQNLLITQESPEAPRKKTRRFYPEIMVREKLKSWTSTTLLSFKEELSDFVAMIGGRHDVPLADGYAGLRSLEVAAAVRQSTASNQAVELPVLGRMKG